MMPDRSLLQILEEIRGRTLRVLQGVTGREALWAPPGLHNHILWHAGHSCVLVESLASEATAFEAAGFKPQIPEGWFEMFKLFRFSGGPVK